MFVALILIAAALIAQTFYILYYKWQIRDIGKQLSFVSKHHSFKYIQIQLRAKEIYELVKICNVLLSNQRELNGEFHKKHEEVNATIVSLSHDIRTPLTSLDGYLQLAESSRNNAEKSRYMGLARSRMKQIVTLVDELFYYSKLQNPEYQLKLFSLDVIDVLHKRLFASIDAFGRKEQEPDLSNLAETQVLIAGDLQALERVFENIISNYLLHGDGVLSIGCDVGEDAATLHFTNRLKNDQRVQADKIFNRFYKEDPSRTLHSSGLGLSIVKSLVEKMGGSAQVGLEENSFRLSLTFTRIQEESG